jgi:hypothetical protein
MFWMVTFSVLFLNALNIFSVLDGCIFSVVSKCKWALLFCCTDIYVFQLWAYSFVYFTEHSRVEGKTLMHTTCL